MELILVVLIFRSVFNILDDDYCMINDTDFNIVTNELTESNLNKLEILQTIKQAKYYFQTGQHLVEH